MSDAAVICSLYDHARGRGLPAVLATVVRTQGSTYRKRGARMMLVADGSRVGVVSGGCLEADVARRAWFLKSPGESEVVRYDTGTGEDATYEFGLGCRGVVEVLLERLDLEVEPPIIAALRASVYSRQRAAFVIALDRPAAGRRDADLDARADATTFVDRVDPPVRLIAFGSGPDVVPVVAIARAVGWQTLVVDHRVKSTPRIDAHVVSAEPPGAWQGGVTIDARTVAVVMTHRMADDARYLDDLLRLPVSYIGCLGPLARTEALIDQLAAEGIVLTAGQRAKIHAPVGLDLGSERPEEIGLAIIAEAQAALAGAHGSMLSRRGGAIHGPVL